MSDLPPPPAPPGAAGEARIHDRGYRRYDGPRTGLAGALRTTVAHAAQRVLGLRRSGVHKIVPVFTAIIAYLPAIVLVGILALVDDDILELTGVLEDFADYYGNIVVGLVLFAAFATPEVLAHDRSSGMLGLYLASPLDRHTYLLAKAGAVVAVLCIVTTGPLLFLLVGYSIEGYGPDSLALWLATLLRIVVSGLLLAAFFTLVSLAVTSLTPRRGVAAAAVLVLLIGSRTVASIVVTEAEQGAGWLLVDVIGVPFELVQRIFGETNVEVEAWNELPTALLAAVTLGWCALSAVVVVLRYRKLTVTR